MGCLSPGPTSQVCSGDPRNQFFIPYSGETLALGPRLEEDAFVSAIEPDEFSATQHQDDPRVIDRIQYKSRTSFSDELRTHVWLWTQMNPVPPQELTFGRYYESRA